jgi:glycosyltransferase involved in cell wall biosynthesis
VRVGIDVSPLALTRAGTARYITCLLAALADEPSLELRRYGFGGAGRAAKLVRDVGWYLAVLPAKARRDAVDVLHCTTIRGPVRATVPVVLTVHDVAVLRLPETFNRWTRNYSALTVPRVARAAARIITFSSFSRDEIVDVLGVPATKVHVIPHGVGPPFVPDGPANEGAYVLAVSTLEPRKNLPRVLEGFRRSGIDAELVVVGARGWGGVRVHGERVRWLGEVPDDELARLYRGASCVSYVSLYEGFGLPILEAMACGTPVVTSRFGACAEVAGRAAVLVDPVDEDAIAAGLVEAIERCDELARLGRERARGFDWRSAASKTVAVYREAAAS